MGNLLFRFERKQTDINHGCMRARTYHPRRLGGSLLLPPCICAHSDYGHVPHNAALLLQSPDRSRASKPIHDGHFNVHQYDGQWDTLGCTAPKRGCLDDVERFDTMIGDVDGAAQGVQLLAEDLLVDEVVLYDEDRELCRVESSGFGFGQDRGPFLHFRGDCQRFSDLDKEGKDTAHACLRGYANSAPLKLYGTSAVSEWRNR